MNWKKYINYRDIRFWLVLFFIIRLYAITAPPLEFQHPWRQADGLMIARNFYETLPNIFYPMVDTAGEKSGITGSEFPILNYLIYLTALLFGYDHWYGRLIVLIVSTLGSFYFYKCIKKFFDETVAFNATLILMASYWFSYSRKTFPDCFAASLCLIALYFVLEYLEKGKITDLIIFLLLATLGGLSKITSMVLLSVVAIPILFQSYPTSRKVWTTGVSGLVLIAVATWYFIWVPHLNETYGYGDHFLMGYTFSEGWAQILNEWPGVLRRLFIRTTKYLGFIIFAGSLIYILYKKQWLVFWLFIIPYFFFLLIIVKTGASVIADQYYILSSIPAIAFVSGYGLSQLPNKKVMLLILFAIVIENVGDQTGDFRPHPINKAFANLESIADSVSRRDDLIVANSDEHCPTAMYFAHRKGWTVSPAKIAEPGFLEEVKQKGCKFVLICKQMYGEDYDVKLDLPQVFESESFRVYSLQTGDGEMRR